MIKVLGINAVDAPGGAELGLLRLARRLQGDGWAFELTSPGDDGPLTKAGFPHHKLDVGGIGTGEGARAVASWPKALILARDFDVVYLNSTVCGRLLPALRGSSFKTVLHVHDIVDRVPRHWHRADVVLADSQAVADRLDDIDAHVVYCPVELDPPLVDAPWPASVTDGGPVIGFVGRIEERKGVLDLVEAAPLIRRARPDATIVVMGDDPYGRDPDYLARVKSAPGIVHLPWTDDAGGVLRHLDVLVAPSRQEPFGTVISEAMAVGTPVVATNVGGLPEVVEHGVTGVLVEPGSPEVLAAAVVQVLAEHHAMAAAAKESAKRFGADRYAARVAELIAP